MSSPIIPTTPEPPVLESPRSRESQIRPNVFDFLNYRDFIRQMVEYLRLQNRYSIRKFAKQVGFRSHSFVKMIVDGQRALTEATSRKIAVGFEMSKPESDFLVALVNFNDAPSLSERDAAYRKLKLFLNYQKLKRLESNQYEYFSNPGLVLLHEALGTELSNLSLDSLANRLRLSRRELESRLMILKGLGLADEKDGKWFQVESAVETSPEMRSLFARNFHQQMLNQASQALDSVPVEERSYQSVTIPLSQKTFDELNQFMTRVMREANALYSQDENPDKIYHLSLQMFPLLKIK